MANEPINNQDTKGKGGEPDNKNSNPDTKTFDPTKIGDEEFSKVFDDPRVWQHERFKQLTEEAKKAKQYEKAEEERKEKELEKEKKFEELAAKARTERDEALNKVKQAQLDNRLTIEASKAGAVDVEAVLKLVDRSKVSVDDNGVITGADTAVKELLESKPFLKGEGGQAPIIGSGTSPAGDNSVKKFTLSQIQDPKFYGEHREEIKQAYKTPGAIINDLQQK